MIDSHYKMAYKKICQTTLKPIISDIENRIRVSLLLEPDTLLKIYACEEHVYNLGAIFMANIDQVLKNAPDFVQSIFHTKYQIKPS